MLNSKEVINLWIDILPDPVDKVVGGKLLASSIVAFEILQFSDFYLIQAYTQSSGFHIAKFDTLTQAESFLNKLSKKIDNQILASTDE